MSPALKPTDRQLAHGYDPLSDAEPYGEEQRHSRRFRSLALAVALLLAAISVLTATYSLFRGRPQPELTRPLPEHVPHQGAIR